MKNFKIARTVSLSDAELDQLKKLGDGGIYHTDDGQESHLLFRLCRQHQLGNEVKAPSGKYFVTINNDGRDVLKQFTNPKPKRIRRARGEHRFLTPDGGISRCITCGCDEDDAFVAGEECSYGQREGWSRDA